MGLDKIAEGFRYEDGMLQFYTKEGRKRKNWKSHYRRLSQKYLKKKCERETCGSKEELTIHHIIPLSKHIIITKENCMTLCNECHKLANELPIPWPTDWTLTESPVIRIE